jgi:hypothetical protein
MSDQVIDVLAAPRQRNTNDETKAIKERRNPDD